MKKFTMIHKVGAAVAVLGLGYLAWRKFGNGADRAELRNDAAGPRLPAMPNMPTMPAMPTMPGMPAMPGMASGAAPNAPQFGPSAPAGLFSGMWN